MRTNFDAIIFDLGGVILNIDYQKTISSFKKMGIKDFDNLYTQAHQSNLFDKLETGNISENEFYNGILEFRIEEVEAWKWMPIETCVATKMRELAQSIELLSWVSLG